MLVDVAIIAGAVAIFWPSDQHERRGSVPPANQTFPDLSRMKGIEPPFPSSGAMQADGSAVLLVASCFDCRSGDVLGGYLQRHARVPTPGRLIVIGWDGDGERWHADHGLSEIVEVHTASSTAAAAAVRRRLAVDESAVARLYDTEGTWVSTFHLGQLDVDDVTADFEAAQQQKVFGQ